MSKIDRRILKSQEAMKTAVIELMTEKSFDEITLQDIAERANISRGTIYLHYADKLDLLNKLIEEHIEKLRSICRSVAELDFREAILPWFEYLEQNYLFFSTMLASKGATSFRNQFVEFLREEFQNEVKQSGEKNDSISEDILLQFIVTSYAGITEWWIINKMPYSSEVMADQVGLLLDRNL
ncbi:AcrR family transcriptional regulator [Paenibacillus sp. SORGH_AS306]|uniref:TetR/AcrR family transcriptional regulator n=1 Tax=unclassified Paenibacillus TaxID=185978 RepID=UPI00278B34F4|nr:MULTISPECIES: TetR/AcrR family transcriptional regulator [unclassified Paenibacillus]MDQ1234194.1 AcrR family transcriptional regulator [Paenibacillus sp. SORGH_AS_0306]MDR6111239.1 AcrR family transcriptional regulator [Paenibacillus sp. SORGH_AS_0338]